MRTKPNPKKTPTPQTPKVIPKPNPKKTPTPQSPETIQKPEYKYAGKETLSEIIGKAFPRQLIPTKRMGTIFGIIFILIVLLAIFRFPLGAMISGEEEISLAIGYPYPFFNFGLTEIDDSPLKIGGLIIDLILYLIIAYIIDVLITLFLKNPLTMSEKEKETHPKTFKDQKPKSISETVTKKVFQKKTKKPPTKTIKPTTQPRIQPSSQPRPSQ